MKLKVPFLQEPIDVPSLEHTATFTCGGVTGHAVDCDRGVCMRIIHLQCSVDSVHLITSKIVE